MHLETECPQYHGFGKIYQTDPDDLCTDCKGTGKILSEEGKKLIAFMNKYFHPK